MLVAPEQRWMQRQRKLVDHRTVKRLARQAPAVADARAGLLERGFDIARARAGADAAREMVGIERE